MLPNFSLLRLERGADTSGFYNLTPDEVDDLNQRQEQDPVTLEDFVSVFRVTVRNANGTETHKHYNAKALWQAIQSTFAANGRLEYPGLQTPLWREDWYELHNQYDPNGPVPPEVAQLSRLDDSTGDDTEGESEDESEEEEYGPEEASEFMDELKQRCDAARDYPSRERWDELGGTVNGTIESCSNEGGQDFQNAFQDLMANGDNETFFRNALARTSPNDMVVNGILIKLLSYLVLEEDQIRDMVRRWGIRDDVRRYAAHVNNNRTYPDPPSAERREYEIDHQDNRLYQAARLLHYLKWQEWIPDSLMAGQFSEYNRMFAFSSSRPLSQEQQAVVDELKTRVAALVALLDSITGLSVDWVRATYILSGDVARDGGLGYVHLMKEIKEIGKRMLQTEDYPISVERHTLVVDVWVAMNNAMHAKLLWNNVNFPGKDKFRRVVTALVRLVWTMASAVHEDIAQPDELNVDKMNDFFWNHVSRAYERPPNDVNNTERVEEILKIVSEFWAEEDVERIDGPSSPPRRRPRLV
jgi:hypothetical protein